LLVEKIHQNTNTWIIEEMGRKDIREIGYEDRKLIHLLQKYVRLIVLLLFTSGTCPTDCFVISSSITEDSTVLIN
jgi:hypothetical protein